MGNTWRTTLADLFLIMATLAGCTCLPSNSVTAATCVGSSDLRLASPLSLSLGTSSRIFHYPQLDDIIEPRSIRIGLGISTSSCRSEVTIRLTGSAMSPTITLEMDGWLAPMYLPMLRLSLHDNRSQERTPHGGEDMPLSQSQPSYALSLHPGPSSAWFQAGQGMALCPDGLGTMASRTSRVPTAFVTGGCR